MSNIYECNKTRKNVVSLELLRNPVGQGWAINVA